MHGGRIICDVCLSVASHATTSKVIHTRSSATVEFTDHLVGIALSRTADGVLLSAASPAQAKTVPAPTEQTASTGTGAPVT